MESLITSLPMVAKIATNDYVGFTFFVGCMAMMAASAFFFLSMNNFDRKWRTSILVSGLITFIAAVHYWYMRDYWAANGESPTFFRYVDWILTVPLMCVEFYLILKVAGAKKALMWKLIALSVIMLVTGYLGETVYRDQAQIWGLISGIAYFVIVYEIWLGGANKLAREAGGAVLSAHRTLCWFVLVGWAIYPIGYMAGTPGWYDGIFNGLSMDVIYNIGDAINKIGFGLVVYNLAVIANEKA
ncbi:MULTISPECIES: bacteriorhodopsin-like [unclassified Allomuricauda]|jgi:bacteriorhodopsin|uniref:bacteriorhodopsin-like n=1 Tax=Flavobacteriaceae TaxID=49546 RepID=UPI001B020113|nr:MULTISPECIES: bacteriorhodopsin-like [unclassified Allomuricauda]MBO6532985.1 bacteriorhodopsin [Allomuricauda sp.]MBO6588467.1 bacteriorhodopsin [Allomuricauda sp.]MBO6618393.1 bacteriorhodopsin [Allomuricauda sp.]MBO6644005.1 bacteriorhodopsin [Allomuricauda sp.]MBO6746889.1 bacteriorhodopsin [Allomuricauda sp.]